MRKRNQPVVLENILIDSYAAEGKSLSKKDGKVIFVEGVIPGDIVDIQLIKNKKDWAEGKAVRFKQYATQRVDSFCQHFGICGGCQWQMLPYTQQLVYKQQQVADVLQRIGKVPLPVIFPIEGCTEDRLYRNKIEYTFSNKKYLLQEELRNPEISPYQNVAGFHVKGIFDKVIDIDVCHLQSEPTNQIRKAIADYARSNNWSFYDIRLHQGFLRTMQIRLATTGELMVNVVFGYKDDSKITELFEYLLHQFPQITTLLYTINENKNDSLYDLYPQSYFGKGFIIETLENFKYKIGPKSFFQTNTKQAEKLYQITREFAELTGKEMVYDFYCGTGSIGIFLSQLAKKIIGVEVVAEAIEDAKENAFLNGVSHASFFTGDVIDICTDEFFHLHGRPDVIVTDPPRAGMHEKLIQKLIEIDAPTIVYVSCNPATQARDLNILAGKYSVEKIQPVDMFPQTHHIENIVQLKLKDR